MKKEKPSTKLCKHCKTEIPFDAKVCPNCKKKQGASGCLIVIIVFLALCIIGALGSGGDNNGTQDQNNSENQTQVVVENNNTDEETSKTEQTDNQPSPENTETIGQKNARATAKDYLNYTAFSYSGLVEQLKYEGFTTEEATYAVDNCGADWNEQAAKMAQNYLDYTSFSRSGLIEQLEFEGFTTEQAEYGVQAVGY